MINTVERERAAAKSEVDNIPESGGVTAAEIHAMIDSLGDVGAALSDARPESLSKLYDALGLELRTRRPGRLRLNKVACS